MSKDIKDLKIAITHDYLYEYGGAEQVLWELLKMFPSAVLYTSVYRPTKKQRAFWFEVKKHRVNRAIISRIRLPKLFYKGLLFLQVSYFWNLRLRKYDVVISSSSAFAKYIRTPKSTKHIAYIHTPPRFIWGYETAFYHKIPGLIRKILQPYINKLRVLDKKVVKAASTVLTNSKNIQTKIKETYGVDAKIVYPPVQIESILNRKNVSKKDFYLTIGRLYDYKKIDLIVKAFAELNKELIVIGDGPQRKELEKTAGENTKLAGFVDEEEKIKLLQEAKGFVFAAEEDFGIVMVEALAAGTPVIAYNKGGAQEIIENNKNGILFNEQTVEGIKKAIDAFEKVNFNPETVCTSANKFSPDNFRKEVLKAVEEVI